MVGINQEFEEDEPRISDGNEPIQLSLFLTLEGFEGPIDVLLSLAREQKVDLTQISILELAQQYLELVHIFWRNCLEFFSFQMNGAYKSLVKMFIQFSAQ